MDPLPADGWALLQRMLPENLNDAPCSCMIKFGDAMSIFGSDASVSTAETHKLLKISKDFALRTQKDGNGGELNLTDSSVECVLVHVAALGCSELQALVDSELPVAVEIEKSEADGLSTLATLENDVNFVARAEELSRVGSVVEAVFTSKATASRDLLLLRGYPGLGKSAAAKQGLRLMQNKYLNNSCCNGVEIPSVIRGLGAAAVQEDLVRWGRELGSKIGVDPKAEPEAVLSLLKAFLEQARYVVLIDDADEAGLQEALKHVPPSQLQSALLVTSQKLKQDDMEKIVFASGPSITLHKNSISICELQPFTDDECNQLMQRLCPCNSYAPLYTHNAQLCAVYEKLTWLPLAVRLFGVWLRARYRAEMKARQNAAAAAVAFCEVTAGVAVAKELLVEWISVSDRIVLAPAFEHTRGLQGTVRLAIHLLKSHPLVAAGHQLIAFLALCPQVQVPWSLFDGGGTEQAALMIPGSLVVVKSQAIGHESVVDRVCRIPKLNLEAIVVSDSVKEGGKVAVQLSDGKIINVQVSNLVFRGDASAVEMDGHWFLPRQLRSKKKGRVMQEHADGSISVMFQGLQEGCHVRLRDLPREELNGCFGFICGAYDGKTHRWHVRVKLPSNEVKDLSIKADNLECSGKVMTRGSGGPLRGVLAFASGWLTKHRPGAEVVRFKREDVRRMRAEGVLADVTDALGAVGAAVGGSGLVDVNDSQRLFGMHQLLQQAVRTELGDTHSDAMAALLEARCGCFSDEDRIDHRMHGVMREVVNAAAHVLDQMKAVAANRAEWICGMRVRLYQLTRRLTGDDSRESCSYLDALEGALHALDVEMGHSVVAEFRAINWWLRCFGAPKHLTHLIEELPRKIEDAIRSAPDAIARWDCSIALGRAQHMVGSFFDHQKGQYDVAIEFFEKALRTRLATLGDMHPDTGATYNSLARAYSNNNQHDLAMENCERALRIRLATLGDMHPETAGTFHNLAVEYRYLKKFDQAIQIHERALHIRKEVLGDSHSDTVQSLKGLSSTYIKMKQFDQAMELLEQALLIQTAAGRETSLLTANIFGSMSDVYKNKEQLDQAIHYQEKNLRIHMAKLGGAHPETVWCKEALIALESLKFDVVMIVKM